MIHLIVHRLMRVTKKSSFILIMFGLFLFVVGAYVLPVIESQGGNTSFDSFIDRVYWFIVTLSTVGYGDLSPSTPVGKLVCGALIIVGLGWFASVITHVVEWANMKRRKKMTGEKSYEKMVDHVVIFGYHERKTKEIITQMLADSTWQSENIILVARTIEENPFDGLGVKFIKGDLHADDTLERCSASMASKILIDAVEDGETIITAIAINALPFCKADVVVYVEDPDNAKHVSLNNKIRVIQSMEASLMVQEVQDPGVVKVVREILSTTEGNTIQKIRIPVWRCHIGHWKFSYLFGLFKGTYDATILAVETSEHMVTNPPPHFKVHPDMSLFVISQNQIKVDWDRLSENMAKPGIV